MALHPYEFVSWGSSAPGAASVYVWTDDPVMVGIQHHWDHLTQCAVFTAISRGAVLDRIVLSLELLEDAELAEKGLAVIYTESGGLRVRMDGKEEWAIPQWEVVLLGFDDSPEWGDGVL